MELSQRVDRSSIYHFEVINSCIRFDRARMRWRQYCHVRSLDHFCRKCPFVVNSRTRESKGNTYGLTVLSTLLQSCNVFVTWNVNICNDVIWINASQKPQEESSPVGPCLLALFLFVVCGSGKFLHSSVRTSVDSCKRTAEWHSLLCFSAVLQIIQSIRTA